MWYATPGQGWGTKSLSRKQSVAETDISQGPPLLKPSAGRVIRIINYMDHSVQVKLAVSTDTKSYILYLYLHIKTITTLNIRIYVYPLCGARRWPISDVSQAGDKQSKVSPLKRWPPHTSYNQSMNKIDYRRPGGNRQRANLT